MSAEEFVKEIKKKENRTGFNPLCYDRLIYLMEAYAEAENKELQGYVKHKTWCKLNVIGYEGKECTCGLNKLLEK